MRATAPENEMDNSSGNAPAVDAHARISLRFVTGLELASVVISVLITTWGIIPLLPDNRLAAAVPGLLALWLIVNSHRVRGESLKQLGFTAERFGRAIKLLSLPTLLVCAVFLAIGYFTNSFHRSSNFWTTVIFLPFWGTFQQWVLQGFIYRRVRALQDKVAPAIIISAAIFSFVHLPNPALMALTFTGGLIWSWVYERAPNLFALGLSHALMSILLMTTLPPWLLQSMSVGYKHFLYQKF